MPSTTKENNNIEEDIVCDSTVVRALGQEFDLEQLQLLSQKLKMKPIIRRNFYSKSPKSKGDEGGEGEEEEEEEAVEEEKTMLAPSRQAKFDTLPMMSIGGSENINGRNSSGNTLLGVRIKKTFQDEDTGKPRLFEGIITAHDDKYDLYKVSYEDGDEEEVTLTELEEILTGKNGRFSVGASVHDDGVTKKRKRSKVKKTHSVLTELEEILASELSDNATRDGGSKKRKRPKAKKTHSVLEIV